MKRGCCIGLPSFVLGFLAYLLCKQLNIYATEWAYVGIVGPPCVTILVGWKMFVWTMKKTTKKGRK